MEIAAALLGAPSRTGDPRPRFLDVLLLVPPYLSLLYAISVQVFLAFPRECTWTAHSRHIALRTAWVGAASAIGRGISDRRANAGGSYFGRGADYYGISSSSAMAAAAAVSSVVVSAYLVYRSRVDQIQGPAPRHLSARGSSGSMWGKVVLVTGANAGIGRETARQLFEAGATVIMGCRNEGRCREAMDDILGGSKSSSANASATQEREKESKTSKDGSAKPVNASSNGRSKDSMNGQRRIKKEEDDDNVDDPSTRLIYLPLDLSSLSSVRHASATFHSWNLPLHVLINNAGVMMSKRQLSKDGFELTMGCNHLGHFLLTLELLPLLQKEADTGGDARIVTLSSSTYALSSRGMEFDDPHCQERGYGMFAQYSQSKLANILIGRELARREAERVAEKTANTATGANAAAAAVIRHPVASHIVHPGLVRTDVVRNMPWYLYYPNIIFGFAVAALQKTPEAGAYTSVYCASSPELRGLEESGRYYVNSRDEALEKCALDEDGGRRLWQLSEKMVGWAQS